MKTKTLIILLILFCGSVKNSYSQNTPAISENAVWITYYSEWTGTSWHFCWILYKTGGDTLISNIHYIKLNKDTVFMNSPGVYTLKSPPEYCYAFRNDTMNRAYLRPANDTTEYLWYDFPT